MPLGLVKSRRDDTDVPWLVTVFMGQDLLVVQFRCQVEHAHLLNDVVLPDVFLNNAIVRMHVKVDKLVLLHYEF